MFLNIVCGIVYNNGAHCDDSSLSNMFLIRICLGVQDVSAVTKMPTGKMDSDDKRITVMECFHFIHTGCLTAWMKKQGSNSANCPQCKKRINLV